MNISLYISRKIAQSSTAGNSGTIIKIAIGTIALSIATMILATTVLFGFKNGIKEKVFGFWGHIHITDTKVNRSLELSPILDNYDLKRAISEVSGKAVDPGEQQFGSVKSIHPFIMLPAIINRKSDLEGIILKGVNEEYDWNNFAEYLKEGSFPAAYAGGNAVREILISQQTALRLKVSVGDKLVIYFLEQKEAVKKAFTISGIYKTGLEEYDVKFAFLDMSILQDVLEWGDQQVGGFEVFIDNIEDVELIADHIYQEILPANLYAQTIMEKFESLFEWIELQDMNAILLLVLMTIVALINMSTALLILILERSKMIGILKSLGSNNWEVRKIFLYSAMWIMGMALLIGNVLGLSIAWIQQRTGILKLDEANYYLSEVPIDFEMGSILIVNLATVIVSFLFMFVPSYLVTKITPIKILRFD